MNLRTVSLALLAAGTLRAAPLEPRLPLVVPATDELLLDRVARDAFAFFWYETDVTTGLTKDRAGTLQPDNYAVASIATTGFALAAFVVGTERGWVRRDEANARVLLTLRAAQERWHTEHGFYYHFVGLHDGQRVWNSEISSVDTALFLYGALTAGAYFGGEAEKLADSLHRRVDWPWMLNGADQLSHGWRPDTGFIRYRWDNYSETLLINLLAQGSPTHPPDPACWTAWSRANRGDYRGRNSSGLGLFVFNYNGCWLDWRDRPDVRAGGQDYHRMAADAVWINHRYCQDQGAAAGYDDVFWGLSATDTPEGGYSAYCPPPGQPVSDGTICPWAVAGALPWAPELALPSLRGLLERHGGSIYGRYGFVSAANRRRNWVKPDAIGIDVGAALLGLENYRSGLVWRLFGGLPSTRLALQRCGLRLP